MFFIFFTNLDLQITQLHLYLHPNQGLVAQLNSALDYGSRGYWFESSQGHKIKNGKQLAN